jgi:tetratricopeptide (TPR) repeat protein
MIRAMVAPVLLAGAVLCVFAAGGCRNNEQKPSGRADRPVAEKGQTPYYYGLIEEYQNVLAGDPHNLAAFIALGNAYSDAAQWQLAAQYYEQALRLNPHLADVVTDMGTCYRNLGMPDRAITQYEKALTIEPTHQNALFNLGIVYGFDRKEFARAIAYWEQLLHVSPKHPQAEYLQATMAQFRKAMKQKAN